MENEDLFGTAVIEAARIAASAKVGEILVSDVVRQLVKGKDFLFADRGEATLKGFDEPLRLYKVRWREGSAPLTPAQPRRTTVGASHDEGHRRSSGTLSCVR